MFGPCVQFGKVCARSDTLGKFESQVPDGCEAKGPEESSGGLQKFQGEMVRSSGRGRQGGGGDGRGGACVFSPDTGVAPSLTSS